MPATALPCTHLRPLGAAMALLVATTSAALAQDAKLPNPLSWTAYDVGSAGYNQSVAIGKALKDELGIDLRVLPGKNVVSRQITPIPQRNVQTTSQTRDMFQSDPITL